MRLVGHRHCRAGGSVCCWSSWAGPLCAAREPGKPAPRGGRSTLTRGLRRCAYFLRPRLSAPPLTG
jgi:hypothetical protein